MINLLNSYEVMSDLLTKLRDLSKNLLEAKKISPDDHFDVMCLAPQNDTQEALDECVKLTINTISKSVYQVLLARLVKMAVVIEDTPTGDRKNKMLSIYDETEKECSRWKRRILID
jgi:hypothetical protein